MNINGMNVYQDLSNTPISFLQDAAGSEYVAGKGEFLGLAQKGLIPANIAFPFLDYKGRLNVIKNMFGPKSSNPVLTDAQANGLVWHSMIADVAQSLHTSGRRMGNTEAQKKAFLRDAAKRIQHDFFDAAGDTGGYGTSRTTEFVEPRAYVKLRKPYSLASGGVFPIVTEGGPGAELYSANYINRSGEMKVINGDASNDLPVVTGNVNFVRTPIIAAGASYKVSVNELAVSEFAKMNPLMNGVPSFNNLQLSAAVESYMSFLDQAMAYGLDFAGLPGLFNNPDITPSQVASNSGATSTLWTEKTQDEVLEDIMEPLRTIVENTGGSLVGTALCVTAQDMIYLATAASNDYDKKPFLAYLRQYLPSFTGDINGMQTSLANLDPSNIPPEGNVQAGPLRIYWSDRFEGIGGPVDSGDLSQGYYNGFMVFSGGDESALKGVVPLPMTTLAPQWSGLNMVTPFWCKTGGAISRYPDAVQIRYGQSITYNPARNTLVANPEEANPIGN